MGVHLRTISSPSGADFFYSNKVDIADFIVPFKGQCAGKFYDALFPPRMEFPNNPICSQFKDFISSTFIDRFKAGSLIFWGKVGQVQPPHLVMPITVEPTKPRMCHDKRFLNLWIKDCPFRWITYLTSPGTLVLVIFRLSVMTRVATTTFVYLRQVEPFLGFRGKGVISFMIPSPSDERQVPTSSTPLVCWRIVILEPWECPARNTSTITMQASLWHVGNQPLQFGLTLNWPRPLLLFSFQFSLHWVICSRCQNRLLSHPSASVSWVTAQILF